MFAISIILLTAILQWFIFEQLPLLGVSTALIVIAMVWLLPKLKPLEIILAALLVAFLAQSLVFAGGFEVLAYALIGVVLAIYRGQKTAPFDNRESCTFSWLEFSLLSLILTLLFSIISEVTLLRDVGFTAASITISKQLIYVLSVTILIGAIQGIVRRVS